MNNKNGRVTLNLVLSKAKEQRKRSEESFEILLPIPNLREDQKDKGGTFRMSKRGKNNSLRCKGSGEF